MDEEVIKRLYSYYLDEVFDIDKRDFNKQNFVIHTGDNRAYFVMPSIPAGNDYTSISYFKNGYALVKDGIRENIINSDGLLLSKSWFDKVGEFKDGLFYVKIRDSINFIDTNGKLLFKDWKRDVSSVLGFYPCGVAVIGYADGHYSLVNKDGIEHIIGDFDIDGFIGKYTVAKKKDNSEKPYYIIDNKGKKISVPYKYLKQISDELFVGSFDKIGYFYGNDSDKEKYFIVDCNGKKINDNTYDYVDVFSSNNNYTIVRKDGKYNLLGRDGLLLTDEWYDKVEKYNNDLWLFENNNKFNFVGNSGIFASSTWFDSKISLNMGFVVVEKNNKFYIMDDDGTLHSDGYETAKEAFEKNAVNDEVKTEAPTPIRDFSFNVVNYKRANGEKIFENDEINFVKNNANCIIRFKDNMISLFDYDGKLLWSFDAREMYLKDTDLSIDFVDKRDCIRRVKCEKKWRSYKYIDENNNGFSLSYRPVIDYGSFIICEVDDLYYLYSKETNEYEFLGKKSEIELHNNYLSIKDKKYYIGVHDFIDITDIDFKHHLDVKSGITKVASLNEFRKMYRDQDFQEKMKEEIETIRKQVADEERKSVKRELEKQKEMEIRKVQNTMDNLDDSLNNLADILKECSKYISEIQHASQSGSKKKVIVPKEILLVDNLDHLEINQIFLMPGLLRYIDLSIVDFDNVKVDGIDLSYTNARINPQTVYNKDMSNGKYRGLDFNLCDFTGVNTDNSDFDDATMDFAVGYGDESTK